MTSWISKLKSFAGKAYDLGQISVALSSICAGIAAYACGAQSVSAPGKLVVALEQSAKLFDTAVNALEAAPRDALSVIWRDGSSHAIRAFRRRISYC